MDEKDLENMKVDLACNTQMLKSHDSLLVKLAEDIVQIKDKLLGRPSWNIMLLVSTLATACGTLLTYVLTTHR